MSGYLKTLSFIGTICYYIALFFFLIFYFPVFLVTYIFITPFDKDRVALHYVSVVFCFVIVRLCPFWNLEIEGTEKIDPKQTYIIASNHQSMMDIPIVGHALPLQFRYIAKREVYNIPIIGWIIWLRDDITVKRGGAKSAKAMIIKSKDLLSRGISILIFPEGTRSKTGKVEEFKDGAFMMAKLGSLPIVPMIVDGTWEVSNYFGKFLKMPTKFRLTILDPIPVEDVKAMSLKDLTAHVHSKMLAVHKELEPNLYKEKE